MGPDRFELSERRPKRRVLSKLHHGPKSGDGIRTRTLLLTRQAPYLFILGHTGYAMDGENGGQSTTGLMIPTGIGVGVGRVVVGIIPIGTIDYNDMVYKSLCIETRGGI